MDTLVELYDQEPIENILAASMFKPKHIIYICEKKTLTNRKKNAIYHFLKNKGLQTTVSFYVVDSANFNDIMATLKKTAAKFQDCVFELTGGTDLILLGAGIFCKENNIPCFYIDLKHNRFINIFSCDHLEPQFEIPTFSVSDILTVAGASLSGHGHFFPNIQNAELVDLILAIWNLIVNDQDGWAEMVAYFQHVTKLAATQNEDDLLIRAPVSMRVHERLWVTCNLPFIQKLNRLGAIENLEINDDQVHFSYKNEDLKRCLISHGIWLELYSFITAKKLDFFNDVQTSVMIDWDGETVDFSDTKNEIDLILVKGIVPIFISCKTAQPSSLALSEIALISKKFGGELAKTVLISSSCITNINLPLYKRAKELDVFIIDFEDIKSGNLGRILMDIAQNKYEWKH